MQWLMMLRQLALDLLQGTPLERYRRLETEFVTLREEYVNATAEVEKLSTNLYDEQRQTSELRGQFRRWTRATNGETQIFKDPLSLDTKILLSVPHKELLMNDPKSIVQRLAGELLRVLQDRKK